MEDHRLPFFLYWLIVLKEKTEKKQRGWIPHRIGERWKLRRKHNLVLKIICFLERKYRN
jgi:hypothetical protein